MGTRRNEQCRLNILGAALEVMEERGYLDLTIEEVAGRAKAGKQTIYRNWGNKRCLALEAIAHKAASMPVPDTGSLHGDLLAHLGTLTSRLCKPGKRSMLAGLLAEVQNDPEFGARFRGSLIEARRGALRKVFQRGLARGEVDPDADLDVLLDLVSGPVWYRLLISGQALDDAFRDGLADRVCRAARVPVPRALTA